MAGHSPVLAHSFWLQHFNHPADMLLCALGVFITGMRLIYFGTAQAADVYDVVSQLVRFVLASTFVACYWIFGFSRYVYIRGPLGALARILCAVGLGYKHPAFCSTRLCERQWPWRLLMAHMFPLFTNSQAIWYWIGGAVSLLLANLTDHALESPGCSSYPCALEALAGFLQSPLQLLPASLFGKNKRTVRPPGCHPWHHSHLQRATCLECVPQEPSSQKSQSVCSGRLCRESSTCSHFT
jgi:hypothetical protein